MSIIETEVKEVEKEVIDNSEDNEVEEKDDDSTEDSNNTERKPESLEDRKARLERQLSQTNKKLGIDSKPEKKPSKKSDGLDYGQKAYLVANGIKGESETKLVQEIMSDTGKTLEQVLDSRFFQAELKEMRELQSASEATPKGKRSNGTGQDSVEYWLAKGELPPASEVQLRRDVVNARLKKTTTKAPFYNS